jgi:hydroxymethylpyrimidine/phosphomethylpyrimidine kinase
MAAGPVRVLTIAGSDSSGGAGLQADLKTFAAHGAYGMTAVTAVTAQTTREVLAVLALPAALVAAQIDAVLADRGADAVKIGMLADAAIVRAVAERLRAHLRARVDLDPESGGGGSPRRLLPIVLDPVLRSTSGTALLAPDALATLTGDLLPLATLVTPNLPELEALTGRRLAEAGEQERWAVAAALAAASGVAVLAKGGHAVDRPESGLAQDGENRTRGPNGARRAIAAHSPSPEVVDLLVTAEGTHRFAHPRLLTRSPRGTGCILSAAIAVRLGAGEELPAAVEGAIAYLLRTMAAPPLVGVGSGPLDHPVAVDAVEADEPGRVPGLAAAEPRRARR